MALSLMDATKPPPSLAQERSVIEVNDDSDEEFQTQLRLALEASKIEAASNTQPGRPVAYPQTSSGSTLTGMLTLSERAQLEKERLERQKRFRAEPATTSDDDEDELLTKRQRTPSSSTTRADRHSPSTSSHIATTSNTSGTSTVDQVFWDGELRQTANKYADHR